MNAHRRKEAKAARRRKRIGRESEREWIARVAYRESVRHIGEERMERMVDARRLVLSATMAHRLHLLGRPKGPAPRDTNWTIANRGNVSA